MKLNINENSGLRCRDCGYQFIDPENDDLCPNCYSANIEPYSEIEIPDDTTIQKKLFTANKTNKLEMSRVFSNGSKSMSAKRREKNQISDCLCCVIWSKYNAGYFCGDKTVKVGDYSYKQPTFDKDRNKATIFSDAKSAYSKIEYGNLQQCTVETVKLINNEIQ